MNSVVKKKFLAALRSGNYNVSGSSLYSKDRFNIFGVLCKVTGNLTNRNTRQMYPRINSSNEVQEFMGLSPQTQERLMSIASTDGLQNAIRYISRNVKAR